MAKLEGPDADIEISLKDYGIAWEIGETDTRFYYGIAYDGEEYITFDWADLENDLDVLKEYDWVEFEEIMSFVGMELTEWEKTPLVYKIRDLMGYYGTENIFGSTYTDPMTYKEITKEKI